MMMQAVVSCTQRKMMMKYAGGSIYQYLELYMNLIYVNAYYSKLTCLLNNYCGVKEIKIITKQNKNRHLLNSLYDPFHRLLILLYDYDRSHSGLLYKYDRSQRIIATPSS